MHNVTAVLTYQQTQDFGHWAIIQRWHLLFLPPIIHAPPQGLASEEQTPAASSGMQVLHARCVQQAMGLMQILSCAENALLLVLASGRSFVCSCSTRPQLLSPCTRSDQQASLATRTAK